VDVLIIGAGASGAAIAWSLAETRMKSYASSRATDGSGEVPGMRADWELGQFGDFALSPNARKRPRGLPVNDADSPIAASMFKAVGRHTIFVCGATSRAFIRPDFRVRTMDRRWPTTGPSTTSASPFYDSTHA